MYSIILFRKSDLLITAGIFLGHNPSY